jgi:hypothetical protein
MAQPKKYERLAEVHTVVVFRGPVGGGRKTVCVDRGVMLIEKRVSDEAFVRLVFYPKNWTSFDDLSEAIVVPFNCIDNGKGRMIRSATTGLQKGEVIVDLKAYVDTRVEGLERFTIWMHKDAWAPFCRIMLLNLDEILA